MGTNLSLFPLPTTLIRPSSKNKSEHLRLTSSLTRKPQEYSISSMAVFRTSMGRSSSKLVKSFSTSDADKVTGRTDPILGGSTKVMGLLPRNPSTIRKSKNTRRPESKRDWDDGFTSLAAS